MQVGVILPPINLIFVLNHFKCAQTMAAVPDRGRKRWSLCLATEAVSYAVMEHVGKRGHLNAVAD